MTDTMQADICARPATIRTAASRLRWLPKLANLWQSRRALSRLSADQLRDVGIDQSAAAREARRAVWDVPATWHD